MTRRLSVLLFSIILVGAGCASRPSNIPASITESQTDSIQAVVLSDGFYQLDVEQSKVAWEASKVKLTHNGFVSVKDGVLQVEDGVAQTGTVVVDVTTLKNLDQKGNFLELLENHLKSADFFNVILFPEAEFVLSATENKNGTDGINFRVDGTLTIKSIAQPLSFDARVEESEQGIRLVGRATVDRTLYDIRFGSGKFFQNLGDNLIADNFYLDLDLLFVPDTTP